MLVELKIYLLLVEPIRVFLNLSRRLDFWGGGLHILLGLLEDMGWILQLSDSRVGILEADLAQLLSYFAHLLVSLQVFIACCRLILALLDLRTDSLNFLEEFGFSTWEIR